MVARVSSARHQIVRRLECIMGAIPGEAEGVRRACEDVDDWEVLLGCACRHGVESVLLVELERAGDVLPAELRADAGEILAWRRATQGKLHAALDEALAALEAANV